VAKRKPHHPDRHPVGDLAKGRVPNPASHNEATRAERTAAYEFEVAMTNRPSRMSSRGGAPSGKDRRGPAHRHDQPQPEPGIPRDAAHV